MKSNNKLPESVKERIRAVNIQLQVRGYSWDDIVRFWEDCVKDAKKRKERNGLQGSADLPES